MKKMLSILLLVSMWVSVVDARSALDPFGKAKLKALSATTISAGEPTYIGAIIKVADDTAVSQLEMLGVVVFRQRQDLLLACIPDDKIEEVARIVSVQSIRLDAQASPEMNYARPFGGVDKVSAGLNLSQSYDGSGVVVGFADIGFDPNHINFRGENGVSRVRHLVSYKESCASRIELTSAEEIAAWSTDDVESWHATHVAGVLTGSYAENGYQGVAPGADIVATTSQLSDVGILAGVEDIVEYAKEQGKPAVVNLSLGSYIGPHDGTDLFCQYLDMVGEDAVICIAAGNEGHRYNCLSIDVASSDAEYKTFVYDMGTWAGKKIQGYADFWSADSREFSIAMCIYDRRNKTIVYKSSFIGKGSGSVEQWGVASDEYTSDDSEFNDVFSRCFNGYVNIYAEENIENNRYNVTAAYKVENRELEGLYGRYYLGFIIKGSAGMHIDGYADGSYSFFHSHGVEGFIMGDNACSISNIACGYNVAVVGACSTRNTAPTINAVGQTFDFEVDNVAKFSGYGTLIDGRVLPNFCAPGNMIVSSISTPFVETLDEDQKGSLAAMTTAYGREYYWLTECGTSMACPYTAGVFALWLQADPSLDVHQLVDIALSTAQTDYTDITNPRWGAGCIDAYAGLVRVIEQASIDVPKYDECQILLMPKANNVFEIFSPENETLNVKIYSTSGVELYNDFFNGSVTIDLSHLVSGVYVIEIIGNTRLVEKIIVK